jgi:ABC-type uncharacterized transport system involved in gliding motility auxiliary subunit
LVIFLSFIGGEKEGMTRQPTWLIMVLVTLLFFSGVMVSRTLLGGWRLDLTQQQLYSLSEGSRLLLNNMDAQIDMRLYYSREQANALPALKAYAERVIEFLTLYERLSGGKVRLHLLEPEAFTEDEDEAAAYGVQAVPISTLGDKLYFGVVATNGIDEMEVIPFLDPKRERFLEYDVTRILHRLSLTQKPKLGLVSSLPMEGGMQVSQGYQQPWTMMSYLEDVVDVTPVALDAGVQEDVELLMLIHPQELSPAENYAIDQFVMRGGKLMVFADPLAEVPHPMGGLNHGASSLNHLLEPWGVTMVPERIVGDAAMSVRITTGTDSQTRLNTIYYLPWLELTEEVLADAHATTANLQMVRFASTGAWQRRDDAALEWVPLVQSSRESGFIESRWMQGQPDASQLIRTFEPDEGGHVLAAHASGWLQSQFPDGPPEGFLRPDHVHLHESAMEAQIMLVADTDMLRDVFWLQAQDLYGHKLVVPTADNASLVVNMIEYLSGSQSLIQLRSRGLVARPFKVVEAMRREAEARFQDTEEQLKQELEQTENSLARLQQKSLSTADAYITAEEQATLDGFRSKLIALRKELRDVQYALQSEIDQLGVWLKWINIGLMPLLILCCNGWIVCRRRRAYE